MLRPRRRAKEGMASNALEMEGGEVQSTERMCWRWPVIKCFKFGGMRNGGEDVEWSSARGAPGGSCHWQSIHAKYPSFDDTVVIIKLMYYTIYSIQFPRQL